MSNRTSPEKIQEIHSRILEDMKPPPPHPLSIWLEKLGKKIGDFFEGVFSQLEKTKPFWEKVGKIINRILELPPILLILILLGLLTGLILLTIFIIKKIRQGGKAGIIISQPAIFEEDPEISDPDEYFAKAMGFGENGDYNNAILTLHRGSVIFLYQQNTLKSYRDYTNREICRILKNDSEQFKKLATKAEEILFGDIKMEKNDFDSMKSLYKVNFYA